MHRADRLLEPGQLLNGALVGAWLHDHLGLAEPVPGQLLGAFRIERELARGGMGIVYLAARADGEYEQQVAIKWLPVAGTAAGQAEQFRHERQVHAQLRHPHIARLLDGGHTEAGHLWFAMEYVEGLPVDRHAAEAGLGWAARVRLLLPVIEAVQFAHARLLVHRDIKPANVLVDCDGRAKLLDFGVAALLGDGNARVAYSDGFASPEQRAGAPPQIGSDVWQLGRLLAMVLAAGSPARPAPRLPRDLMAILARATATVPAQRYATAAEFRADLDCLLAHRPVAARPPHLPHRLALLLQAHPLVWLGSALAVLAFAVVIAGFVAGLAHERDAAEHARAVAEATNAFLEQDVLPGADPLQAGGSDVSVADLAERALARVEPRLHAMPEVAGQVELSLGTTLGNLGRFRAADRAFARAIGHFATVHGPHDVTVLQARLLREQYAIEPERMATAEARLRTLREDVRDHLGMQAALLDEVDNQLARAAFLRDDFMLCARRYGALLPRLAHAAPGTLADTYRGLSLCESRLGRWTPALAHAQAAQVLETRARGADHPLTLETRLAVESALVGLGRYQEAIAVLRGLDTALEHRYGATHPTTLNVVHDLGLALTCAGDADEGIGWLRRAAQGRARALGPRHPWYAMSESVLGMALNRGGHLDLAAAALARARNALRAPQDTPFVWATLLQNEADLALAQGHGRQAAARYATALAAAERLYPPGSQRLAVLRLGRGLALRQAGEANEGLALLRDALQAIGNHPDCRGNLIARARAASID